MALCILFTICSPSCLCARGARATTLAGLARTQVVPTARSHLQRWAEVVNRSDRSVTLIDLCGHEKYLKTTVFGLTGKASFALILPLFIFTAARTVQLLSLDNCYGM